LDVPPSKIPTDLDAQAALYRSLLADKRVLVILDNARDVDQVRPLLPGTSGSIAVITSRNQLSSLIAQGAHPVTVDQLDAHDAGRFLARRLREERTASEPEATARIIDACAGLPLALAIVAARAAAHPDFPLAALAAELHDSNDRLNALADPDPAFDIRAVFSWSYRALAPDTARLIRLLSLHPGPDITAAAAASLAGIAPRQANRLLADLTRANLLVEQSLGRFSFHDLLRVYASERAIAIDSQEDRSEAVGRMLDHYLHSAHAANELIDSTRDPIAIAPFRPHVSPEHPADAEAAMAWFNAERTVLTAAVDRAAAQGFDVQCWQLAWTMPVYLNRRGHWHDQVLASKAAVEAARRLGDTAAQIRALRMLAHAYTRLERFEEAHLLLGRALALSKSLNDRIGQAHILQVHGRLWRLQGRFPEAIACTEKALGLFKASGHREGEASALNSMGWHHALIGDHRAALAYCEQSMIIMQAIGHRSGQATTWHSLGYIDHGLGRHAQAVAHYQRALDLYRELEYRIGEAETLNNLGDTLLAVGDHVAAGRTWRRALVILDGLGHTDAEEVRDKLGGLDVPVDLDRPADGS
jgi:tetratricopeptide (TPR) repeat protein